MIAILGLLATGSVIWYTNSKQSTPQTTPSPQGKSKSDSREDSLLDATPVVVTTVRQDDFNIYQFGLGVITPLNAVEVRSRVKGQLMSIAFKEGQMVKAGDLLAQIDPLPFEMELRLATAQQQRDQALFDNAIIDLDRYQTLQAQDSISQKRVDTQQSLVHQYQAAALTNAEVIKNAELQLSYTHIKAPISGRTGFRLVSPGNIVDESDASGIVKITQLNPIGVIFSIPEDALPRVMKLLGTGDHVSVDIYGRALKEKIAQGRLLAAASQIDATTGTIKLKAELPNANGTLFANQFVNVKMSVETLPNAMLIPTAAIQRGAMGTFIYVVKEDQTATVTPIKTGPSEDGITAIEGVISAGAMVVIDGADNLREGAKIKIVVRDTQTSSLERHKLDNDNKSKLLVQGTRASNRS